MYVHQRVWYRTFSSNTNPWVSTVLYGAWPWEAGTQRKR